MSARWNFGCALEGAPPDFSEDTYAYVRLMQAVLLRAMYDYHRWANTKTSRVEITILGEQAKRWFYGAPAFITIGDCAAACGYTLTTREFAEQCMSEKAYQILSRTQLWDRIYIEERTEAIEQEIRKMNAYSYRQRLMEEARELGLTQREYKALKRAEAGGSYPSSRYTRGARTANSKSSQIRPLKAKILTRSEKARGKAGLAPPAKEQSPESGPLRSGY